MEIAIVFVLLLGMIYVSVGRRPQQEDPLYQNPTVAHPRHGPKINHLVHDREWADGFVRQMAISDTKPLTDADVRNLYSEIVNKNDLSTDAKYYMLDGLSQRVANDHPRGMGADVLEEISNESIALTHPEWHGRHGNWNSVKQ